MTYKEIFDEFCQWSPEHAQRVIDYRPWGTMSIVIWFSVNDAYKVKRIDKGRFIMQKVTMDEINRKLKLI